MRVRKNRSLRSVGSGTIALASLVVWHAAARADEAGAAPERRLAVGVKVGLIPPVLVTGEALLRPAPHLAAGVFGIVTAGGIGNGGTRVTFGAELVYEFLAGRRDSAYLSASYAYYHAAREADGSFETAHILYATAGYIWKWSRVDAYVGGGVMALLSDETPPCRGWGCIDIFDVPPVLPTLEAGLRYALF